MSEQLKELVGHASRPGLGVVVGQDFQQTEALAFDAVPVLAAANNNDLKVWKVNGTTKEISLPNGCTIKFHARTRPEALRGIRPDWQIDL